MVHIVEKKINGSTYLYLQRSVYNKGNRKTEHVAYIGDKKKFSKEDIKKLIKDYSKKVTKV